MKVGDEMGEIRKEASAFQSGSMVGASRAQRNSIRHGGSSANLNAGDLTSVVASTRIVKAEHKTKRWKKLAGLAAGGAMLGVLTLFGVVLWGNEVSKDFRPSSKDGDALLTSDGSAVATADVAAYATMLDLPYLGSGTLNKIDAMTFVTFEGLVHKRITGYKLSSAGGCVDGKWSDVPHLSLETAYEGTTIEISVADGEAWLASGTPVAKTTIELDGVSAEARRKLAEASGADHAGRCLANGACLYSKDELLELRAEGRRLSGNDGYFDAHADIATFELEADDVVAYLKCTGDAIYGEGGDEDVPELTIRFAWANKFKAAYVHNATDNTATLRTRNGTYTYDADGNLAKCYIAENTKNWFENFGEVLESVEGEVSIAALDKGKQPPDDFMPEEPTMETCEPLMYAELLVNLNSTSGAEGRRRLYSETIAEMDVDPEERRRLTANDDLANNVYSSCTYSNGNACVLKDGCTFAFRGSDDLTDWISNAAGVFSASTVGGKSLHGGFVDEFNKLQSLISGDVGGCVNPTFVGHSLGGAMATVAANYYGKGSVVTFGAPQLYDDYAGCYKKGTRLFHEEDPVAGNMFGANSAYWHSQEGTEIYWSCNSRNWWGSCKSSSWRTRAPVSCSKNSGTYDANVGAHSMTNYVDYY